MSIRFPDGAFTASARHESALRLIAEGRRFIVSALPGDLDDGERVALVAELVRRGLLSFGES